MKFILVTRFTKYKDFFLEKGFILHPLDMHRTKINLFKLIKNLLRICFLITKIKPNLVHSITIKPVILGGIASKILFNTPFVASISGLGYVFVSKSKIAFLLKKLLSFYINLLFLIKI